MKLLNWIKSLFKKKKQPVDICSFFENENIPIENPTETYAIDDPIGDIQSEDWYKAKPKEFDALEEVCVQSEIKAEKKKKSTKSDKRR